MARKRKAGGPLKAQEPQADNSNKKARLNINSYEDVAGSDDEFHINRDKILLDEAPDAKRRRQWEEKDEFLEASDEEVLAESDKDDLEEDDDEQSAAGARLRRNGKNASDSEDADSAVSEDELSTWGASKKDYYGADDMETEQDALDEEAEARRIQQKQLQGMTAADYGFDESEWQDLDSQKEAAKKHVKRAVVTEVLPQLQVTKQMGPAERLKILKTQYPEFEPLSKELLDLQEVIGELGVEAQQAAEEAKRRSLKSVPAAVTKHRAAGTYLAVLTMYFALLTSTAEENTKDNVAIQASILRDHPVMDSLLKCREMWLKAQDLVSEPFEEEDDLVMGQDDMDDTVLDHGEVKSKRKPRKARKTKAQKAADAAKADAEERRLDRIRRTEADLADLDNLLVQKPVRTKSAKPRAVAAEVHDDSDLGEETELTAKELEDKAKKRKSLRFYTSQIAQKANKRGAAGRNAGGDDDVPYRERLRDRQERLMAEAANRGKKTASAGEELGGESDEEDSRQAREVRGEVANADDNVDEDGYYDMVAAKSAKKKNDKAALAEAMRLAAERGGEVIQEEVVGPDGKRAITYAIEKNKGLTPHRKKDVRNPRVKKRKKYEEKNKKLASMKPTYKGGEGRGGYGGELTGIKTNLVRSRKL